MMVSVLLAMIGAGIFGYYMLTGVPVAFWQPFAIPLLGVGAVGYVAARAYQAWDRSRRRRS